MDGHHLSSITDLIAASAPAAIASTRQHTRDPRMMPLCKFDARRFFHKVNVMLHAVCCSCPAPTWQVRHRDRNFK